MLLAVAVTAVSNARTLQVGGRNVTVPDPEGYVEVTPEMSALYGATQKMVDPDNDTLGYYIPAEMAAAAKAGEATPVVKYFVLKVKGDTKFVTLGSADFEGLVAGLKSSNQMITDELKSELGDSYDPAAVVALRGAAVLPPHLESKTAFANSMLINRAALGGGGEEQVMAATTSYANVGGKILLLYGFGAEKDLDWTRTATGAWTDAVLASNPEPPADGGQGDAGQSGVGDLGGSTLKSGLIGAVIGGVVAFLLVFMKNRRRA